MKHNSDYVSDIVSVMTIYVTSRLEFLRNCNLTQNWSLWQLVARNQHSIMNPDESSNES